MTIAELQNYMHDMTVLRGFDQQSALETLLVMLEEFGELAKAVRKYSGIKIDHSRLDAYGNLKHETADVLICLVILANKLNIDLMQALQEKEAINSQRQWKAEPNNV